MIEELQATGRWTFTFVGANIDSISTASRYGIDTKNVMQFSADELSNKKVYASSLAIWYLLLNIPLYIICGWYLYNNT